VSISAVLVGDGQVLLDRQGSTPVTPASVQKLLATAVALRTLGADFAFTTRLVRIGNDLAVVGDGDPTLGDPYLAEVSGGTIYDVLDDWAAKVRQAGPSAIAGDLVLDDSIFSSGRHPDWPAEQLDRWYCAPVSGLNFNTNCIDVTLRVTAAGVEPAVSPVSRYITVSGRITRGGRDLWSARLGRDDASLTFSGQASRSSTEPLNVPVNDPTLLAGRVLADRLARAGVELKGQIVKRRIVAADRSLPAGAVVLATHSMPLPAVLARTNKRSLNMGAECVLLRSAAAAGEGTFAAAAKLANQVLARDYHMDPAQFSVADGSGMSRNNRLSAAALAGLLAELARGPHAKVVLDSLAVAGVDGSLDDRLKTLSGRVIGKTGTLTGVSTLAGYVLSKDGRPVIAFAIFCTGNDGAAAARDMQDALLTAWIQAVDGVAP
jgi:D-alanyl-D-alanine carboxypeptidase/D-alanyl-D-alanine-endopeptidase (penicillin-binding protein 4)